MISSYCIEGIKHTFFTVQWSHFYLGFLLYITDCYKYCFALGHPTKQMADGPGSPSQHLQLLDLIALTISMCTLLLACTALRLAMICNPSLSTVGPEWCCLAVKTPSLPWKSLMMQYRWGYAVRCQLASACMFFSKTILLVQKVTFLKATWASHCSKESSACVSAETGAG